MNHLKQRDIIYQQLEYLDLKSIRQLCQTDREYATLCREPQFKTLIDQKYKVESSLGKVYKPDVLSATFYLIAETTKHDEIGMIKNIRKNEISEISEWFGGDLH